MCNFWSFLAIKNGKILEEFGVNSHEDLIEIFKDKYHLKDDNEPNFVRIEFTPPKEFNLDFTQWNFKVDQDIRPDWFVEEEWRQKAIDYLTNVPTITEHTRIHAGRAWFCTADVDAMISAGAILLLCGGTVNEICGGTVNEICGGTVNEICGGTVNEIWGGTVNAIWGGTVNAIRGGTVNAIRGGTVNAIWGGTVNEIRGGTVNEIWGGTVNAIWGGTVKKDYRNAQRTL